MSVYWNRDNGMNVEHIRNTCVWTKSGYYIRVGTEYGLKSG